MVRFRASAGARARVAVADSLAHSGRIAVLSALLLTAALAQVSHGAPLLWDNGSPADMLWSTGNNWNPDTTGIPGTGDTVTFDGTGSSATQGTVTNILDAGTSVDALSYSLPNTDFTDSSIHHTTQVNAGATLTVNGAFSAGIQAGGPNPGNVGLNTTTGSVTITGQTAGDGALVVNAGSSSVAIGINDGTWHNGRRNFTMDMRGLGIFSATTTGYFYLANGAQDDVDLYLADTNNSITANKLSMAGWNSTPTIYLGGANALHANSITLGGDLPGGTGQWNGGHSAIRFRSGLVSPSVTIRNQAGTGRANLTVGLGGNTNGVNTGTMDLSAGTVDALLGTVIIGQGYASLTRGNGGTGTLTFGAGTIDATDITVAYTAPNTRAINPTIGTLNINGPGTLIVTTLTVAEQQAAADVPTTGTVNLNAGTLRAATIQGGTSSASTVRTFNWSGGTIGNKLGGDLTISASMPLTLKTTASHTFDAETGQTITVDAMISESGASAGITKIGGGMLTLNAANSYSGATAIDVGTLRLGNASALGTTAGATTVASGAVLDLNGQAIGAEVTTLAGTGLGNGALTNSSAAAASLAGNINPTGSGSYSVGGTGDITLTGNVRGVLTKVDSNTLTLGGAIDNGGLGVVVNGGTVLLAKTSSGGVHAIGGSTLTINNGTLAQITGTGGDQIYFGGNVQLNDGTFDLNGNDEGFHNLNGAGGTILNNATGTASTLTVGQNNGGGTFGGVIADNTSGTGTMALTKTGSGTLTLSGANTYSGLTTIEGGTLRAGNAAALGTTVGATTVASGAVLDLNGQAVGAEVTTLAGTGLGNGALTNSSAAAASLAGNINPTGSGSYSVGGTGDITLTGNVRGVLTKVDSNTLALGGAIDNGGLGVVVNGGTVLLAKTSSGGVHAIGGNTLTINNGTLAQITGTGGDQIYFGGNIQLNDGTFDLNGNSEGFDSLNGAGGTIVNNATGTAATLTVGQDNGNGTFGGVIADNTSGTGTMALTKTGSGTLTLSGANTYSGLTTIEGGTLRAGNAAALGTTVGATTVASGAVLDLNGQAIGAEVTTLAGIGLGNGALTNSSAAAASLAGNINPTGSGSYSVGGTGDITLTGNVRGVLTKVDSNTLTLGGAIDNAGLGVVVNAGTVLLAKTSSGGVHAIGGSTLTINNGTLVQITGTGGDQIYVGGNVQLNDGTFDLNGNDEGFHNLNGAGGTIVNNATGTASTLTVGQNNGGGTFGGVIADNTSGTGTMALTKTGTGTLTVTGANTYSGGTAVDGGTLLVNNVTGSGTGSGIVTVNGGTLGGTGTIAGPVAVGSGILGPGTSPGILTLQNGITFTGGSFAVELNGPAEGTDYDQLLVTGSTVDLGLGATSLDISGSGGSDFFWIINNTTGNATDGHFLSLPDEGSSLKIAGQTYYIYYEADYTTGLLAGGNDVLLTSVPEPSTLVLLLGLLGMGWLGWRWRRRSATD